MIVTFHCFFNVTMDRSNYIISFAFLYYTIVENGKGNGIY